MGGKKRRRVWGSKYVFFFIISFIRLLRMDNKENQAAIRSIFSKVYGSANVDTWIMKWRMFFLACAELFGYNAGNEWQVSHYLFKKK